MKSEKGVTCVHEELESWELKRKLMMRWCMPCISFIEISQQCRVLDDYFTKMFQLLSSGCIRVHIMEVH